MLEASCKSCPEYKLLHSLILQGLPTDSKDWDACLLPYYRHRHLLTSVGPVVLVNERPVIPKSLRGRIVDHVHAGHPGLSTMCSRLSSTLYWPDYRNDLMKAKLSCPTCLKIAPSNPAMPPRPPATPQYPFQSVVCDFFTVAGQNYVALADRYSNWLSVLKLKRDTSEELIAALRNYFATFGVPELFSTDGASIFTSHTFRDFCARWGIEQRISSAYHPRSNKRAELAVKHAKRLILDSLSPNGSLDTDSMARALLSHRNTPDDLTGLSPAQVLFGRVLRAFLPASPGRYVPRPEWRLQAEQRELAHARRHVKMDETLHLRSRNLPSLHLNDFVSVQDQAGNNPRRWSKTGRIVEECGHDSFLVKIYGSNRVTKRNRQFLRKLAPFKCDSDEFTPTTLVPMVTPADVPDAPDLLKDTPTTSPTALSTDVSDVDRLLSQTDLADCPAPDVQDNIPPLPHDTLVEPVQKSVRLPPKHPRVREKWILNPKFVNVSTESPED